MSRNTVAALGLTGALALTGVALAAAAVSGMALQAMKQTDSGVKDRIEYRLETNVATKKYDIHVKVDAGTAILTGDVATAAQKNAAGKLAAVDGVARVQNDIKVDPNTDTTLADRTKKGLNKAGDAITDAWINTKVHWFFIGEDLLKGSDINVDVAKGMVTLKGTVKSAAGRARAVELANQTDGVKMVHDQLAIK